MRYFLIIYFLLMVGLNEFVYCSDDYTQQYSNSCSAYKDPFGPLKTGYTMGDAMRYSATKGLNIYSPDGKLPLKIVAGVQDVYDFGQNTYNLYNAIGYLYAGWLACNNPSFAFINSQPDGGGSLMSGKRFDSLPESQAAIRATKSHWLDYRYIKM